MSAIGTMPSFYPPSPAGPVPLYWRDEVSGKLPEAMMAYLDERLGKGKASPEQLKLVADYIEYFIHAPCWTMSCRDAFEDELTFLRRFSKELALVAPEDLCEAIAKWIHLAMDIGLDPL